MPDSFFHETDPRIRIHMKMKLIRITRIHFVNSIELFGDLRSNIVNSIEIFVVLRSI